MKKDLRAAGADRPAAQAPIQPGMEKTLGKT